MTQLQKRRNVPGKDGVAYWKTRVFKGKSGTGERHLHYSVEMTVNGDRERFALGVSDIDRAAEMARSLYLEALTRGMQAARDKHSPPKPVVPGQSTTVGQWIEAALPVSNRVGSRTLASRVANLRRIAADIAGIKDPDNKRKDRSGTGLAEWQAKADAVRLALLTPEAINDWMENYVKWSPPDRAIARQRSANEACRSAATLFSEKVRRRISGLELPDPRPFERVEKFPEGSSRFKVIVPASKLIRAAKAELKPSHPDQWIAFLLCLLAGLRRGEADNLQWSNVDFDGRRIQISATADWKPKTDSSDAAIALDPELGRELESYRENHPGGPYIIPSRPVKHGCKPRPIRADETFEALQEWLRSKGVTSPNPVHYLRKLAGAEVATRDGIYAASKFLRHGSTATTERHYADFTRTITTGLGEMLK